MYEGGMILFFVFLVCEFIWYWWFNIWFFVDYFVWMSYLESWKCYIIDYIYCKFVKRFKIINNNIIFLIL